MRIGRRNLYIGVFDMWNCGLLRARARNVLSRSYWSEFVATLIYVGLYVGIGAIIGLTVFVMVAFSALSAISALAGSAVSLLAVPTALVISPVVYVMGIVASVFIGGPLCVGLYKYYMESRLREPDYGEVFSAFHGQRYTKVMGAMAWMLLFVTLWSLPYTVANSALSLFLFLKPHLLLQWQTDLLRGAIWVLYIPAFIKTIAYGMTPFILGDNPSIGYRRALRLSMDMTKGQKGHIFLLLLSFIGWWLLGAICCGVGILFVVPYFQATLSELYAQLRDEALAGGLCGYGELGFGEPSHEPERPPELG